MTIDKILGRAGKWSGVGLALGIVAATPILVSASRPLIKSLIKGYLTLCDKAKETVAETNERLQDLYAEAKVEYQQSLEAQYANEDEDLDESAPVKKSVKKKKVAEAVTETTVEEV